MPVAIRCPSCLTSLPQGARRCATCGLDFEPPARRRARGVLLAVAVALIAGSSAWWLRGRAVPSPAPPSATPAEPVVPPAPFDDGPGARSSTPVVAPPPPPTAPPADEVALAALAHAAFRVETRDALGRRLRGASAFRITGPSADVLVAFSALNGAATLVRAATDGSPEAAANEVAGIDGQDLALVGGLAPAELLGVTGAPVASIGIGSQLYAMSDERDVRRFALAGTVTALDERAGSVAFAALAPSDQCWMADASGRLLGFARMESEGAGRLVLLEGALARLQRSRPARLEQIDATYFDRVGDARRERATWYAAAQHYSTALGNYLIALDLEPRLRDDVAGPAAACAQLALRDARLHDEVTEIVPLLERAANLLDREPFVLYACGLALLDEREPEAALPYLLEAARFGGTDHPELVDAVRVAYLHVGEAARADRRPADAIQALEEGLLRFREDPLLLKSLGFAYFEFGDRERARIVFEKVASLDEGEAQNLAPILAALAPPPVPRGNVPSVEIRYDRADGAIRTSARFDDRTDAKVIIDTGATITAISERLADRLKIDRSRNVRRVQIMTANGRVEAPVVLLDSLNVQGAQVTKVEAVVLPLGDDGGAEALVGLNFLEHFALSLDARQGILRLAEKR